jgi:hypothetical protein
VTDPDEICLSPAEIKRITGVHYPRRQLEELHRQGFWRARLGIRNEVILERAHYLAVCAGTTAAAASGDTARPAPELEPIK